MVIKEASDAMSELASQMTTEFTEISKHSLKKGKIEKSKGVLLGHHWKRLPWIAYFIALFNSSTINCYFWSNDKLFYSKTKLWQDDYFVTLIEKSQDEFLWFYHLTETVAHVFIS